MVSSRKYIENISEFVSGKFFRCINPFLSWMRKGECYWFEYIGDYEFEIRSDNALGTKFEMTDYQLIVNFVPVEVEEDFTKAVKYFYKLGELDIHHSYIDTIVDFYINLNKDGSKIVENCNR